MVSIGGVAIGIGIRYKYSVHDMTRQQYILAHDYTADNDHRGALHELRLLLGELDLGQPVTPERHLRALRALLVRRRGGRSGGDGRLRE